MAGSIDRGLDNLIRGSEDLMRGLEFVRETDPSGALIFERVQEEVARNAEVSQEPLAEPSIDGSVEITISPDEMIARACFRPPFGNGAPLSVDAARDAIEGSGIVFGIDWEAVKGSILTCNEDRVEVADVVVARGKKPLDERPAYLILDEKLTTREEKRDPGGRGSTSRWNRSWSGSGTGTSPLPSSSGRSMQR